jgi:hypothetical protein
VSSPTTHRSWFLSSFNTSFALLAEGPCMNPFACLSPVKDLQYFLCLVIVQSLIAFLATPVSTHMVFVQKLPKVSMTVSFQFLFVSYTVKVQHTKLNNETPNSKVFAYRDLKRNAKFSLKFVFVG